MLLFAQDLEKLIDPDVAIFIAFLVFGWGIINTILELQQLIKSAEYKFHGIGSDKEQLTEAQKRIVWLTLMEYGAAMWAILFFTGLIAIVAAVCCFLGQPYSTVAFRCVFGLFGLVLIIVSCWVARQGREYLKQKPKGGP